MRARWNKTMLVWLGLNPNSKLDHIVLPSPSKYGGNLLLCGVKATSYPDRTGEIEFHFEQELLRPVDAKRGAEIYGMLMHLGNTVGVQHTNGGHSFINIGHSQQEPGTVRVQFSLDDEWGFCDFSLRIVKEALRRLGIEDTDNQILSYFGFSQEIYVRVDNEWVLLESWIRMKNELPHKKIVGIPKRFRMLPVG